MWVLKTPVPGPYSTMVHGLEKSIHPHTRFTRNFDDGVMAATSRSRMKFLM
jgi:hypothetical protein